MTSLQNDHLFNYTNVLQQELILDVVEEDVYFHPFIPLVHPLISDVFNERDLEVMLDSVGCIDHPA